MKKQIRSKYLGKRFGGWTVVSAKNVNEGNHKLFTLSYKNAHTSKTMTVRDNDMTALVSGEKTISELSAVKAASGKVRTQARA